MLEFNHPIPVITPLGPGYVIYANDSGMFENDIWTVVLEKTGEVKHFRTDQLVVHKNGTFDITNLKK